MAAAAKEAAAAASAVEAAAAAEEPAAAQGTKELDALAQTGSALDSSPAPPCPLQLPALPRNRSNQSTSNPASSPVSPGAHPQRRLHGQMPRPKGRRAPAPIASPTSIRTSRRRHTYQCPTGSRAFRAHCSTPRCPPAAAMHMSQRPTDSRAPAPISAPGARPERPRYTSPHPTGRRLPAPIEPLPGTRPRRRIIVPRAIMLPRPAKHLQLPSLSVGAHVCSFQGAPCSRAHCKPLGARPQRRVHSYPRPPHRHVPCPTGTRAPAPTPTPPGARPERRRQSSTYPTGTRAFAPTAATPGARPQRRGYKSTCSAGRGAPSPTATPPGAPAPTATPPADLPQQRHHTSLVVCAYTVGTPRRRPKYKSTAV